MVLLRQRLSWEMLDRVIYILLAVHCLSTFVSGHLTSNTEIAVLILSAVRFFFGPSQKYRWAGYMGIAAALGVFYATMLVSAVSGGQFWDVLQHNNIFRYVHDILLLFVVGLCVRNTKQLDRMLVLLFISCTMMDIYFYWQSWHGVQRPVSTYSGVLMTGAMLYVIIVPSILVRVLEEGKPKLLHYAYAIMFLMALLGVFVSGTRGAWLALGLVILGMMIFYARNLKKELLAVAVILMVTLLGTVSQSDYLFQRIFSVGDFRDQSHSERVLMWQSAANMFLDHPVLGVGLGNYKQQYQTQYIQPEAKERQQTHAHSMYLQFLAETGVVGFCGYAALFGYIVFWGWRRRRSVYGRMVLFSTVSLLLYSTTDHTIGSHEAMRLYWLLLGIGIKGVLLEERNMLIAQRMVREE